MGLSSSLRDQQRCLRRRWAGWILAPAVVFGGCLACGGGGGGGGSTLVAPVITTQPSSLQALEGDALSLSVTANGNAPMHYQWKQDGASVGSDAATFDIVSALPADAGSYTVTVVNEGGSVTSLPAVVAVERLNYTLPGGVNLELRHIPAGTFLMGSPATEAGRDPDEGPEHTVTISQAFSTGRFEVTQAQWMAVMPLNANPSLFSILGGGSPTDDFTRPVDNVSWDDCQVFLTALNAATTGSRPAGRVFRLPSEAEWEYACRAGSAAKARFYWGDDPSYASIGTYAWHNGNSGSSTHGTGELKQPNALGLYNMSGNVWEWCVDDLHADYTDAPVDGGAWVDSPRNARRIMRGGAFNPFGSGVKLRSAYRFDWGATQKSQVFGLRVVLATP